MDYIILGLLLLQSRTIYQLQQRIDEGLSLMYSSSMGSIQAAIKKLLKCEYIRFDEIIENGKYKKVYSITETGRQYFFEWVNKPISEQGIRSPELVKVYFMGFANQKSREESISQHLTYLKEQYCVLETICEEAKTFKISDETKDIFHYQTVSAFYGRDLMKFNINWYEQLLDRIRREEI